MKYVIVDMSNLLHRTYNAHQKSDGEASIGMAIHIALMSMNKFYKKFKPDKIVACFDHTSWRKKYTASEECVSQKPYKGNRRQNQTPSQRAQYLELLDSIGEMESLLQEHTSVITLKRKELEADDLIAGFIQIKSLEGENEFIIVSGDKDFIQLLKHEHVQLYDPMTGKPRTLAEWDNDPGLFMFSKCIRGDAGDHVQSAYPGVRKTRILKAYNDSYERENLMAHVWETPDGRKVKVGDLYKENKTLMDLEDQPEDIQKKMVSTILKSLDNPGEYSHFHFLKFCGAHQLKKVGEQSEYFTRILSL